jgi:hypothetical protein
LGTRVSHSGKSVGARPRVYPAFVAAVLKGIFKKLIFRNCENASKIHILKNIAPKIMKPILVDFLGIDLQYKNIVCQLCDTFV